MLVLQKQSTPSSLGHRPRTGGPERHWWQRNSPGRVQSQTLFGASRLHVQAPGPVPSQWNWEGSAQSVGVVGEPKLPEGAPASATGSREAGRTSIVLLLPHPTEAPRTTRV